MTGSGLARGNTELGDTTIELRSVNGRNLSIKMRLAPECLGLESSLEDFLRSRMRRGSVVMVIGVESPSTSLDNVVDDRLACLAAERLQRLADELSLAAPTLRDVLTIPGVLQTGPHRSRTSWQPPPAVRRLLAEATDKLLQNRAAEGAFTVEAMQAELDNFEQLLKRVEARAPEVIGAYRERLKGRVDEFLAGRAAAMQDADVLREVALFADRVDVAEELQRLHSHLKKARELLGGGTAIGRALEFLLQEFLREVNTAGSKSPDAEIAHLVVDMKSVLDRLKEQAANLE